MSDIDADFDDFYYGNDDHILNDIQDDDDEFHYSAYPVQNNEKTQRTEKLPDQQLKEAMRILASGERQWEANGDEEIAVLEDYKKESLTRLDEREKTTPTVLHMLAKSFESDEFKDISPETRGKIIGYLLQYRKEHLSKREGPKTEGIPILQVAMAFGNDNFIKYVMKHCQDNLPDLLDSTGENGMTPLHYAFQIQLRNALHGIPKPERGGPVVQKKRPSLTFIIPMIQRFVKFAEPETIAKKDEYGNTPIHYALDYKLCLQKRDFYLKIIHELIAKFDQKFKKDTARLLNREGQSPYVYHVQTKEKWLEEMENEKKRLSKDKPSTKLLERDSKFGAREPKGESDSRGYSNDFRRHGGR